jgi:methylglutaconyl-CoA hydratase
MGSLIVSPGRVTTVTLNRPDIRNALNDALIAEIAAWAADLPTDGSVRAVILQGAGSAFCAGADLEWMARVAGYTYEQNLEDARRAARLFHQLDTLPVPLIGRIQGAALGGGAGLAAMCDIVVAADDAVFGFTETTLGIVPAMIAPYVVRKIGLSAARALCLPGVRFPAARALDIGLVHEVVPRDRLDAAVQQHIAQFGRAAPSALAATKRLLGQIAGRPPDDVLALTVETIAAQRVSAAGQEGMRAFLEKRKPAWADEPGDAADGRPPQETRRRPT